MLPACSLRRFLSPDPTKPLRKIESAKQLARRMTALPSTYKGKIEPLFPTVAER